MFNLYSVYDKVSKRYLSLSFSNNDQTFIRSSLYSILMDYPLKDIEIHCLGEFDDVDGKIKVAKKSRSVDLSAYIFPVSRMSQTPLTLEEIDKGAKTAKAKIQEELENEKNKERA